MTHWLQDTKKPPDTTADGFYFLYAKAGARTNSRNPYNYANSVTTYIALAYPANNARPLRPITTTWKSLLCVWLRHALLARDKRGIMQGMDDPSLIRCVRPTGKEERVDLYSTSIPQKNVLSLSNSFIFPSPKKTP